MTGEPNARNLPHVLPGRSGSLQPEVRILKRARSVFFVARRSPETERNMESSTSITSTSARSDLATGQPIAELPLCLRSNPSHDELHHVGHRDAAVRTEGLGCFEIRGVGNPADLRET
jgi:hypothetical protein